MPRFHIRKPASSRAQSPRGGSTLHDVGTVVGEDHRGHRAGHPLTEVRRTRQTAACRSRRRSPASDARHRRGRDRSGAERRRLASHMLGRKYLWYGLAPADHLDLGILRAADRLGLDVVPSATSRACAASIVAFSSDWEAMIAPWFLISSTRLVAERRRHQVGIDGRMACRRPRIAPGPRGTGPTRRCTCRSCGASSTAPTRSASGCGSPTSHPAAPGRKPAWKRTAGDGSQSPSSTCEVEADLHHAIGQRLVEVLEWATPRRRPRLRRGR